MLLAARGLVPNLQPPCLIDLVQSRSEQKPCVVGAEFWGPLKPICSRVAAALCVLLYGLAQVCWL